MIEAAGQSGGQAASQIAGHIESSKEGRIEAVRYRQPGKCVACVWGRWEASRQFCMMPVCVKETVPGENGPEGG